MESVIFSLLRIAELYLFLRLVIVLSAAYLAANGTAVGQNPSGQTGQTATGARQNSTSVARQGPANLPGQRQGQGARRNTAGASAVPRPPPGVSPPPPGSPNPF